MSFIDVKILNVCLQNRRLKIGKNENDGNVLETERELHTRCRKKTMNFSKQISTAK